MFTACRMKAVSFSQPLCGNRLMRHLFSTMQREFSGDHLESGHPDRQRKHRNPVTKTGAPAQQGKRSASIVSVLSERG